MAKDRKRKEDGGDEKQEKKKETKPTKRVKKDVEKEKSSEDLASIAGASADSSDAVVGGIEIETERQPLPTRDAKTGHLKFADHPEFSPNLTPKEVMQRGSFGGSYWRPIYSSVTKQQYDGNQWKEFPPDWFEGLNMKCGRDSYDISVNRYKVHCGTTLEQWEEKNWIRACDPYGWFQWYCRFYLGRRCSDDARQIGRGNRCHSPTGRWRTRLYNMIGRKMSANGGKDMLDDASISPVIRQTLQHWGYVVEESDYNKHAKKHGYPLVNRTGGGRRSGGDCGGGDNDDEGDEGEEDTAPDDVDDADNDAAVGDDDEDGDDDGGKKKSLKTAKAKGSAAKGAKGAKGTAKKKGQKKQQKAK